MYLKYYDEPKLYFEKIINSRFSNLKLTWNSFYI